VPIVPVALDYGRQCIDIGPAILPDDDLMATLEQIARFYAGVKGKHPAKAAVSHQNITNS